MDWADYCDFSNQRIFDSTGHTQLPSHPRPSYSASPRNLRSSRTFPTFDTEDAPPTLSLRDSDASTPSSQPNYPLSSSSSHSSHQLPLPPALMASAQTTTLQVFGPPSDQLPHLRQWLEQCGPIKSYSPGPQGSNWFVVEFETPTGASFALRKHGEVIAGKWMVGFKVASGGALESYTPINNGGERGGEIVQSGGIGTPIRVQNTSIVKQKPQAPKKTGEGYAWEETEQPSGIINKAAEWFVSAVRPRFQSRSANQVAVWKMNPSSASKPICALSRTL